ncbi:MAG: cytochrome c [Thermodesulfobacteriota bacterium]
MSTEPAVARRRMGLLLALPLIAGLAGCRQDMQDQPKYLPDSASRFFADGRANRPLVAGTVAHGSFQENTAYFEGKVDGRPATELPVPVTRRLLERGRERYDIFCSPCHDRVGEGTGMIVQRGFRRPPSFHIPRLREAPVGHFYDVITNGFGVMLNYSAQVPVDDRWAIVAYIRALQLAQNATEQDVPPDERAKLAAPAETGG